MRQYLNVSDILLVTLSAYIVVWGINYVLRQSSMSEYQA